MEYREVYFRIRSSYRYDSGWPDKGVEHAFRDETRTLFQSAGWELHPAREDSSSSDIVTKGQQDLYLHPMNFSGVIQTDEIPRLQELLEGAQTFQCQGVDCYERYWELTDAEYLKQLEDRRDEMRQGWKKQLGKPLCGGAGGAPHPRGPPGDGGDPEWPRHSHGGRRGTPAAGRTPPGTAADDPVGGERGDQMSVYITGDTHGGFQRFGSKYFPQQKNMGREDYVIVTGDFGGLWDGSPKDQYWLDWLEEKPFTTLFVDGNHENFDLLNALPERPWNGGRVHVVREHVLHLMRGQVVTFGGLTWFTMGGASSHDIQDGILDPADPDFERQYWLMRRLRAMFRVKGVSWWSEELPSAEEYNEALANLERAGWAVDCILTHCAPSSIVKKLDPGYGTDELTDFLETVKQRCQFAYWFFGHYHKNQIVDERYILQWEQISRLEF